MYKAVVFDLDDTLYDYQAVHKIAMARLRDFSCKRFCVSEQDFDAAFDWAKKQVKALAGDTAASHNRLLYCQKTLERLGKNPVDGALDMYDCYWDYVLSSMELRDGVIELFKRLKIDGVKIAVCTDLTAHIQHRKIRALGLVPYIDILVTSEEAGAEKPSSKMYSLAFEKLQTLLPDLQKCQCLFVGDSLQKDVEGPRAFGMDSALFEDMAELEKKIYG